MEEKDRAAAFKKVIYLDSQEPQEIARARSLLEDFAIDAEIKTVHTHVKTPYLRTFVGDFIGFSEIARYAQQLKQYRESPQEEKLYPDVDEPLFKNRERMKDSNNCIHFPNVTVQCAPLELCLAAAKYQDELKEKLKKEKAEK